jgi:hypothetical protein
MSELETREQDKHGASGKASRSFMPFVFAITDAAGSFLHHRYA